MRRPTLPLLALLSALPSQDRKAELREAIHAAHRKRATEAIERVVARDGREAAEELLYGLDLVRRREGPFRKSLAELRVGERRLFREFRAVRDKTDQSRVLEQLHAASRQITAVEETLGTLQALGLRIQAALLELRDDRAISTLLDRLERTVDPVLAGALARALAAHPRVPFDALAPRLLARLEGEKDPGAAIHLVDSVRIRRDKRTAALNVLHRRLAEDPWQTVSAIVEFLLEIADPSSVPPLVAAIERMPGRVRHEIRDALVRLTGTVQSADPAGWRSWWDRNGEDFLAGRYVPPHDSDPVRDSVTEFFGIPVTSDRMLFVLDRSESMAQQIEWKEPDAPVPRLVSRLAYAREQLRKVLDRIPRGARFNLMLVGDSPQLLSERLVVLDERARTDALGLIDSVGAAGGTNLYAALHQIRTHLLSADNRLVADGVDTVYLFSDGRPSGGQVRDPGEIAAAFAEMARGSRVRFHAVYAGLRDGEGRALMRRIAVESGGTFVETGW